MWPHKLFKTDKRLSKDPVSQRVKHMKAYFEEVNDSGRWDRRSYKQTELVSLVVFISPSVKFASIQITSDLLTNPTQVNSKITQI